MSPSPSGSKKKPSKNKHEAGSKDCFILVSCLASSSTVKMEVKYSSETSVDF
jgi:hypothetical protein